MTNIKNALKMLEKLGQKLESPRPIPTDSAIELAESQLGIVFPASYKTFLSAAGSYGLHFEDFLWVGTDRDLVATNFEERNEGTLPSCLISFLSDGYGTQICFDTRESDGEGEFPIVEWERDMQRDELIAGFPEPIADDFPSWLISKLKEEQEEL